MIVTSTNYESRVCFSSLFYLWNIMNNQKPSQMLRKAWALIDAPEKWTQGSFAKNSANHEVDIYSCDAACFCTIGALRKEGAHIKPVTGYLREQMAGGIPYFNDTHTWEEVKSAWMKAIALAEEDEAKNEQS